MVRHPIDYTCNPLPVVGGGSGGKAAWHSRREHDRTAEPLPARADAPATGSPGSAQRPFASADGTTFWPPFGQGGSAALCEPKYLRATATKGGVYTHHPRCDSESGLCDSQNRACDTPKPPLCRDSTGNFSLCASPPKQAPQSRFAKAAEFLASGRRSLMPRQGRIRILYVHWGTNAPLSAPNACPSGRAPASGGLNDERTAHAKNH